MQTRLLLITLLYACFQSRGQAGDAYIFQHLSQRDGLLHSAVYSITQDDHGYMWIGSANGLQRYDGIRFTNYQKGIAALSTEAVPANIYTGDSFNIWFTCGDVVRLNKRSNRITVFKTDHLRNDKLFNFASYTDEKGRSWWLGKYALFIPDTTGKDISYSIPLVPNYTAQTGNPVVKSASGEVWLSAGLNLLFDEQSKKIYSPDYNPINHPFLRFLKQTAFDKVLSFLLPDRKGNYWFATWDGRVVFFETATGLASVFSVPAVASGERIAATGKATMIAICLLEDSRGTIWAGTNHAGLLRFDSIQNSFFPVTTKDGAGYAANYDFRFLCLTEDRDGNIWTGTERGINIFHPYRQYFQTITSLKGSRQPLADLEITTALSLSNSKILVTTWGGGFALYDSTAKLKNLVQPAGTYEYGMTWDAFEAPDAVVWVGAQHGYLYQYHPSTNKWTISRPLVFMNSTVRCITGDETGSIFFGLHNGHMVKWDEAKKTFVPPPDIIKQSPVISLLVRNGQLWATTENGLVLCDASTMQDLGRFVPVSEDFPGGVKKLHGLIFINDTVLAIGAQHAGLFFFNTKTKKFFREASLASVEQQSVHAIEMTGTGTLWFTTDYSVSRYSFATKQLWRLTIEDGLISSPFSQCSFRHTASGRWITSTEKEVLIFHPDSLQLAVASPASIAITGIKVQGQELPVDSLEPDHSIVLGHDNNFITFYFSGLHYNGIGEQSFCYRLVGEDKNWLQTGQEGSANYTNLSPGNYVFEVKGNNGGNAPVTKWFIFIAAPFYVRWWFQVLLLTLIIGSIAWLVRRRIASIRQQAALRQQVAEAELSALRAQMNPHFIFNCLSAIDNMIETDQKDKATTYLNRFARLIRNVLESSKKTLVPLHSDMETLRLYLQLEQFRCDNRFTFHLTADATALQGDYKVPPLVVQPFVENAIHHGILNREAPGGSLDVSVTLMDDRLLYRIRDNGIGREAAGRLKTNNEAKHTSYGIAITEERIRKFNEGFIDHPVVITDLFDAGGAGGTLVEVSLKTD